MGNIGAERFLPAEPNLPVPADAACRRPGCGLHRNATRAVFPLARATLTAERPGERNTPWEDIPGDRATPTGERPGERNTLWDGVSDIRATPTAQPPGEQNATERPGEQNTPWEDIPGDRATPTGERPGERNTLWDGVSDIRATPTAQPPGERNATERPGVREDRRREPVPGRHDVHHMTTIHPSAIPRTPDQDTADLGFLAGLTTTAAIP